MRKAAGYIRKGTQKAETERQRAAIVAYGQEHDLSVTEWLDCEAFGEVAFGEWMNGRNVDAVIVADEHAVSEDFFEFYAYKCVLKRRHCDLVSAKHEEFSGYQLYTRILDGFIEKLCQVELENAPIRKPHDRRDKAARGAYIGGNAPMGYKVEGGKLVVNPEEVPVVEFIMEQKHQGKTMLGTVEALNAGGYKTRRGKPFVISTVQSIWYNEPFYQGMSRIGKDGEWVKGQHEALLKDH